MRERSIHEASRRKGFKTTVCDRGARPAPDLVDRKFTATAPNQLWVADITYVPTWSGFLFVAIILYVYRRRVVGWAMAAPADSRTHRKLFQARDCSCKTMPIATSPTINMSVPNAQGGPDVRVIQAIAANLQRSPEPDLVKGPHIEGLIPGRDPSLVHKRCEK
jgi:hypothetical protein